MKYLNTFFSVLFLLCLCLQANAQAPQSFTYQTVVREDAGNPVTTLVVFRMSILANSPDGNPVYQEILPKTPNAFGLVTINVGEQDPQAFAGIDWSFTDYFMKTEIDLGNGFEEAGEPELIRSVPYALYARSGEDADADPTNELQQLSREGNTIFLSDGGSVTLDEDADPDPTNELQQLSREGNTISLSDGGSVTLDEDADPDPTNELQQLSRSGNIISLSGGGSVNLEDGDANSSNELQQLSRSGSTLILSDGGSVSLDDEDADPNNEIQRLNISGDRISLSRGGSFVDVRHVWSKVGSNAVYPGNVRIGSGVIGNSSLNVVSTFSTYRSNGSRLFRTTATSSGAGYIGTHGPNGNQNVRFTNSSGNGNHGYMSVKDAGGSDQAGVYVNASGNGVVWGDTKSFCMDHPVDPRKEIWYACIEGPEAAAYERGTGQLKNGEAFISFSDHFQLVINPETMTIQLTPLSAETYGLAVVEKTGEGFRVKELANGNGNFSFDWEAKTVRKGYENFQPVREKTALGAEPVEGKL